MGGQEREFVSQERGFSKKIHLLIPFSPFRVAKVSTYFPTIVWRGIFSGHRAHRTHLFNARGRAGFQLDIPAGIDLKFPHDLLP